MKIIAKVIKIVSKFTILYSKAIIFAPKFFFLPKFFLSLGFLGAFTVDIHNPLDVVEENFSEIVGYKARCEF